MPRNERSTGKGRDWKGPESELRRAPGNAEASPGHIKKVVGAQSARDLAPGRSERQHPDDRGKFLDRPEPPRRA